MGEVDGRKRDELWYCCSISLDVRVYYGQGLGLTIFLRKCFCFNVVYMSSISRSFVYICISFWSENSRLIDTIISECKINSSQLIVTYYFCLSSVHYFTSTDRQGSFLLPPSLLSARKYIKYHCI